MYLPRHFAETDEGALFRLIDEVAVATLITAGPGGLMANEAPLLLDRDKRLLWGHLAGSNPQLAELAAVDEVLVNVLGPGAYVSPNWYTTPGLVPTWNFALVQVRGRAVLHWDAETVRDIVGRLSARHEAGFAQPWTMDRVEPAKLEAMLGAIVGFHIEIDEIQGKYKLSQNRSAADRAGVIDGLESSGHSDLAAIMRQREEENGSGKTG